MTEPREPLGLALEIEVRVRDARRRLRWAWPARLLAREPEDERLVLYGDWERPLRRFKLEPGREPAEGDGVETVGIMSNRSLEFYELRKPYAVAALLARDWALQEYYARVTLPPQYDEAEGTLTLVSLGFDVQVRPVHDDGDLDYEILEHEPPEDPDEQGLAREALLELIELIERREGPFDPRALAPYVEKARKLF